MKIDAYNQSRDRGFLAFLKHRRWWMYFVNPPADVASRITEDGLFTRVLEDGVNIRILEQPV